METIMHTTHNKKRKHGLNRTMQYGNDTLSDEEIEALSGLNRTMQYGNLTRQTQKKRKNYGLNRTMQYGNLSCFSKKAPQSDV